MLLLLVASASAGCDSKPGSTEDTDVVCPSCGATVGGETADFGPSTATCAEAYAKREVNGGEADALGFDGTQAIRVIEQPIDAPMTWTAVDSEDGGPARGYDEETQVHLTLTVDKLMLYELDLDKCENVDCRTQGNEGQCAERFVMVTARGELHTSDGAVTATLPMQIASMLRPDDGALSVSAWANLRDVTGSLQLDPAFPEPHIGRLVLSLHFTPDGALKFGVIDIAIYSDWDKLVDDDGVPPSETKYSRYDALQGRWGSPPPAPPSTGGLPQP